MEHVFPDWMLRIIRTKKIKGGGPSTIYEQRADGSIVETSGQNPEVLTFTVCEPCNTGWMRDHERAASPILKKLILGETSHRIDAERQMKIALWLIKTAMVFDAREETQIRYFTREERIKFRENTSGISTDLPFPTFSRAWIARYVGVETMSAYGRVFGLGESRNLGKGISIPGYAFTLSAGRFVGQFISARLLENLEVRTLTGHVREKWIRATRQIHPPHPISVSWPIEQILDDSRMSLESFSERWSDPSQDTPPVETESQS